MPTVSFNTQFPGYEIIGEIGRSNARVLKARHLDSGDLVAIKHFALNTDEDTLRRFRLESQLMTDIHHPNVVRVREVQLERDLPFIVMEWIEGGSLRALLNLRDRLDVPTTIRLGLQMAEAFRAIHPQGIVHRDIKPENILYRPLPSGELHFLLTDFGVARLGEQAQTMTGQSLMTYEYASPEQFNDPKGVGPATDYYSLGVVLYECLAGRVPFVMAESSGMATFMNQVLHTPPPAPALPMGQYLPASLNALLSWMLNKNPAERLSDPDELSLLLNQANVEQLKASRSSERRATAPSRTMAAPVTTTAAPRPAEPVQPLYEEEEPANSSTWWGVVIGLLVVAALIAGTVYYSRPPKAPAALPTATDSTLTTQNSTDEDVTLTDSAATTLKPAEELMESTESSAPTDSVANPTESQPNSTPAVPPDTTKTAADSSGTSEQ